MMDRVKDKKKFLMSTITICGVILPLVAMSPFLGDRGYWFFIIGCASAATPSDAAVNIYELIANGEYDAAVAEIHCEGTAEEAAELRATLAALFKEKAAPQIESKGGIASCEAVAEKISENGQEAVVTLKITYGNGSVEENDLQTAVELFGKAMAASADVYTYENNAVKLALVYTAMGDAEKAQQTYKELVARFPELKQKYAKFIAE